MFNKQVIRNSVKTKSWQLGPHQSRLLSWSQMTGEICVKTNTVANAIRLPLERTYELLDRMARDGIIIQLARGLYLLPEKLPPGGLWQPPAEVAIWYYMQSKEAQWQETGLGVFNHYGLIEQVSNVVIVYNNKVSDRRFFGKLEVIFIKVNQDRLGSAKEKEILSGKPERQKIATLARAIFDAVYDYSRFRTLPTAYSWIAERKTDTDFLNELVKCSIKYGNVATNRRLGWLLQYLVIPENIWLPLKKSLKKSSSYIPVDPSQIAQGSTNKNWGVIENYLPEGKLRGKY